MEKEKYLEIQKALVPYESLLAQALQAVLDQDVSNYPIFVISKLPISVGIALVEKTKEGGWLINLSSLEEFSTKQLIRPERIDDFRKVYKPTTSHYCLFVLSDLGPQFIFLPRKT